MSSERPPVRYIVAQTGARRGYAVPAILEKAGMLERFYTDVCGNVGWGRWLAWGAHLPIVGKSLSKLADRKVPESIAAKTHTFVGPIWRAKVRQAVFYRSNPRDRLRSDLLSSLDLGCLAAKNGFGQASHLYSMFVELPSLMAMAHEHGLRVISETYILLSADRIVAKERDRFPNWEASSPDGETVFSEFNLNPTLSRWIHHYICPSAAVADDLVNNWNIARDQIDVVPYGMSPSWLELRPTPLPGRILFVGSAILRKGIHYLAMAAEELCRRGRQYEFRVAGHVEDRVRNQPQCSHLTFLDRIPRNRVHEEFQKADVFTLPSLAEGSAEVTYEALAAGLPLVTTRASGSVATDGVEGHIVPERDPIALADAIESIVEDRPLRNRMASAARTTATEYTWARYGDRLVAVLSDL